MTHPAPVAPALVEVRAKRASKPPLSTAAGTPLARPWSRAQPAWMPYTYIVRCSDDSYYVGFEAAGQHIGLVPGGGPQGMTAPVAYWHVPDIEAKLAEVTAAGATVKEPAHDVGGGRLVATVTDPDGNVLGLIQDR